MSAPAAFNGASRVRVDTAAVTARVLSALETQQPQTRGELMLTAASSELELNVALDRAQTDGELVRRIIAGRIVFHLPDWTPPMLARSAAPMPLRVAAAELPASHGPKQDAVLAVLAKTPEPLPARRIADLSQLPLKPAQDALKALHGKGLVQALGRGPGARWAPAGGGITPASPGISPPAAQAFDAETSTPAPAAPEPSGAVRVPSGSRDEPSSSGGFEPATDELLAWHADAAEREAARRAEARAAAPSFADLNDLLLGHAFRNDGAPPADEIDVAQSIAIDHARYALWSDGQLEIDAGDAHLTFSPAAARGLIHYLDRLTGASA